MTGQLQPSAVSVNKTLKDCLNKERKCWLVLENLLTPGIRTGTMSESIVGEIPAIRAQLSFRKRSSVLLLQTQKMML